MANPYSSGGSITIDTTVNLLKKAIDVVFARRDEHEGVLGQFFEKEGKDSGLTHIISSVASTLPLPPAGRDDEDLAYFIPPPGYSKTFALVEYRSGIRVTKTMLKADRFNRVAGMTTGQVLSGFRKDEYFRTAIFTNAFSGTAGADSLSLCHSSHPHVEDMAGTWDNSGTGAPTGANLQALRLLGMLMTGDQGDPDPVIAKKILCPATLENTIRRLVNSPKEAENALNAETQLIGSLEVVVSPYLDTGSTTQYFMVGDRMGYNRGLHEVFLEDWHIENNSPSDARIVIDKQVVANKAFGFTTSQNILGSTGA